MDFESRKKKKSWNEFGVSEIIGNILILMITVVLFSGIMAFVQQMPVPEQATKVDFSAKATFSNNGTSTHLSVTHAGGVVLKARDTIVVIEKDGANTRYNMSDPSVGLKGTDSWRMGITWSVTLTGTSYTSKIVVTVVDMAKKTAVWSSQVAGGAGGNPPNILQRWVDSDPLTPTPDPVLQAQNWSLFVTISDPDNDLNSSNGIWIDSSQIETTRADASKRMDKIPVGDNVYRWDFAVNGLTPAQIDGRVIAIYAWDLAGHRSISTYVMSITQLPTQDIPVVVNPPDTASSGESFMPSYIRWYFDNQGFGIFKERIVNGSRTGFADTGNISVVFDRTAGDQLVFIRFASKVMANLLTENKMTLIDIRTGLPITVVYNGSSTASKPFYPYPGGGGIYLYECQFNITNVPVGAYTVTISLKNQPSTGDPQRIYSGDKTIFIIDQSSSILFYPKIYLYKYSNYTFGEEWGTNGAEPFQVSSGDAFKIYVAVEVHDTDNPPTPGVAEVRISDGGKNSELFGIPPAGNMMSSIGRMTRIENGETHNYYNFSIDLRMNNGLQWRSGLNSYSLYITKLNDSNEGMYSLSEQVFITGAGLRSDFFVGTTGMAAGNSNFNTREYQYYVQNNNFFSTRTMWQSESTPGSTTDYTVSAMALGDTDGDGDKDLLMGQASSNTLWLFENTLNSYGTWQSGSVISRPVLDTGRITWIAFGDVNGDGDDDFAYANENGKVVIHNTTYGSQGWIFAPAGTTGWTAPITKIDLRDMTGDGLSDLVVLASGKISIYDLKYYFTSSLYADRATDKKGYFAHSQTGGITMDFDIDDMDGDGMLDILTADSSAAFQSGGSGPNYNHYLVLPGTQAKIDRAVLPNGGSGDWSGSVNNLDNSDGTFIEFVENGTDKVVDGRVAKILQFQTLSANPDQELRVRARIGALNGPVQEVFYVWYSIDGSAYIPMLTIDSTTWHNYSFKLPSSVANKAIYLKFTDSDFEADSAANRDYVDIDMAGVFTDTFGGYIGHLITSSTDTTWTTIRAASIDGGIGNAFKEVVVAKHHDTIAANSVWRIYRASSESSWSILTRYWAPGTDWANTSGASTSFFVSSASKVGSGYYNNLASTIFDAVDINGDGFTDILVTNYTADTTKNSYIGYYLNLWTGSQTYWRYFPVKSWAIDPPTGQAKDPWVCILQAASLTVV